MCSSAPALPKPPSVLDPGGLGGKLTDKLNQTTGATGSTTSAPPSTSTAGTPATLPPVATDQDPAIRAALDAERRRRAGASGYASTVLASGGNKAGPRKPQGQGPVMASTPSILGQAPTAPVITPQAPVAAPISPVTPYSPWRHEGASKR